MYDKLAQAQIRVFTAAFLTLAVSQPAQGQPRIIEIEFNFSETVPDAGRDVAIAFRSITYIDAQARPLGHIEFATSDAHGIQGTGWYGDDADGFQWSGAAAHLSVPVPVDTEGLLLTVRGVVDGIWADVTVDGYPATPLRVDAYWHDAYLPVIDAVPEVLPEAGPTWYEDRYFPVFPPSDRLYAIRVRTEMSEWDLVRREPFRLNQSYLTMSSLTLVGMQGLINRRTPRVYLNWETHVGADEVWLDELEPHAEVIRLDLDPLSAFHFLWRKFNYLFDGAVVYDPEVTNTINLATMLAGLENRLILAPEQLNLAGMPAPQSISDLVELAGTEGWDNSEDSQYRIYQWVYDNLWPVLEHRILGVISPGPPVGGVVDQSPEWYPIALAERDWYIALNIPALYLDPETDPQATLYETFESEGASPKPITGVFRNNEAMIVQKAAENGDWLAGISWPGFDLNSGNLTVMGGVRPPADPYESRLSADRIMRSLTARHVATLWTPDGDHLTAQHEFAPYFHDLKDQYLGYTQGPWYMDLAPVLWNYYTRRDPLEENKLSIVNAFSGGGYTWPLRMTDDQLDAYLDMAAVQMERSGLTTVYFDDEGWERSERVARRYYEKLSPSGYLGSLMASERFGEYPAMVRYSGVPAPQIWLSEIVRMDNNTTDVITRLMSQQDPGNVDVNLASWHTQTGQLIDDPDALNDDALLFTGDISGDPHCCSAAVVGSLDLPPGDYEASYSMKVSDRSDTDPLIRFRIIEQGSNEPNAVNKVRSLAPSDFGSSMVFEDISLSFSLDHYSSNLDFMTGYEGGATDLYIDNLRVQRFGDPVTPFSAVRMYAGFAFVGVPDIKLPNKFVEAFEAEGGVFLYPEEFLGSLNPEFMIDFAHQYLPAGDPLVLEAESELAQGHFFNAVLKVRAALLAGTGVDAEDQSIPIRPSLEPVYPNPTTSSVRVAYGVHEPSTVMISLYDVLGRRIAVIDGGFRSPGRYEVTMDVSDHPSGVYLVRLETGDRRVGRSLVVVR